MKNNYNIILASKSPRRAEILKMIGIDFRVVPSELKENINDINPKYRVAESLSLQKAEIVSNKYPSHIVIGADTIVISNGKIFGKPKTLYESKQMLKSLSGNSHKVITGISLINKDIGSVYTFSEVTEVFVSEIPEKQIEYYVNNYNTLDKAGSYGIQEWFSVWIEKINGCYYNVMGLPVSKFYRHLVYFKT